MSAYRLSTEVREEKDGNRYIDVYRVPNVDSQEAALADPDIPETYSVYVDNPAAIVIARSATFVRESVDVYDVTIEAKAVTVANPEWPGESEPAVSGKAGLVASATIIDVWRLEGKSSDYQWDFGDINIDEPGRSASITTAFDIGGQYVDVAGEPISHPLRTLSISVPVTFENGAPLQQFYDKWLMRNSKRFDIFEPGRVLFVGYSIEVPLRRGSAAETGKMDFAVDPWYHMRQVPYHNADGGIPKWAKPCADGAEGHAKVVNWYQPFPQTADLTQLLRLARG